MSKSLPPPSIEWLQALLDHIPDRIYFKDRKSRFVGVSRALADFFGLHDPSDAIGKTDFDFFTPEHARPAFEDEQRIVQTGEGVIGKIERETLADGRSGWASTTKMPLIDIDGRVIGTFGISRDITELRETEQALASERRLLRSVIDQLPEFIYVKDPAGRYVLSNLAHARFLGVDSPEAILGRTAHDFFPDEIANRYHADDLAVLASGETLREREEVTRRPDTGAYGWVSMSKAVLRDADKQTVGLVCVARDITERKLGEEQLRQAMTDVTQSKEQLQKAHQDLQQSHRQLHETQKQLIESEKLRSVGRLAAGVAHELKNPLAVVRMGLDVLAGQNVERDESHRQLLTDMSEAVNRADAVVQELLNYAAPRKLSLAKRNLHEVLDAVLTLARPQANAAKVVLETDYGADIPELGLDAHRAQQALLNLVMNAVQATPAGKTVCIRTRHKTLAGLGQNVGSSLMDRFRVGDELVIVTIEDEGSGVPNEKLSQLFDPFFTTKPTGQGTGLGLTVTKAIIEMHGGAVDIRNREGEGAVAHVFFRV